MEKEKSIECPICGELMDKYIYDYNSDPIVGFFYKQYVLGQPQEFAKVLAKLSAITTFANAVVSVILVAFLYNALRPLLTKANLLLPIYSKNKFTI